MWQNLKRAVLPRMMMMNGSTGSIESGGLLDNLKNY
jgi:hypothetical protein